jgi:S1-C subfamily serine protease
MSGQPGDDDAVNRPDQVDRSGNPGDRSDSGEEGSAGSIRGEYETPEAERIACFEAFDRFARAGDLDDRTLAARARWDSLRRKSGALLPGTWAKPVGPESGPGEAGTAGGSPGASESGATASASSEAVSGDATAAGEFSDKRQRPVKLPNWLRLPGLPRASSPAASGPAAPSPSPSAGPSPAAPVASDRAAPVPGADGEGASVGEPGAGRDGAGRDRAERDKRDSLPGWLRGRRLALAAGGLALVCTMLGGVIGGYVALRTADGPTTNPSYTLGTVPPALTNRPATSVAGIAARVTPGVVMIKVNGGVGTGSGFIIRGDYIVTDNHVVTLDGELNNATLRVYFSNGQSAPAELVGRDPYSDIAVIRAVGVTGLPALSLGNSTGVDVGDPVLAVGSPLGLADTVTSGIVSAINRPVQPGESGNSPQVYFDAIQTDAPINPGNSGGPLVNAQGQVIGVDAAIDTLGANPLTGTQGGSIGLGFAIPINQARRVALELIRTGYATHAVIGAQIAAGWGGNGAEIMPAKAGTTSTVTPGGPAALAGLQPGDVIIKFDGQTINDADTLLDAIMAMAPGAKTSVTFTQAGQTLTSTIQLGSSPS